MSSAPTGGKRSYRNRHICRRLTGICRAVTLVENSAFASSTLWLTACWLVLLVARGTAWLAMESLFEGAIGAVIGYEPRWRLRLLSFCSVGC
jgi:hypothetical protein